MEKIFYSCAYLFLFMISGTMVTLFTIKVVSHENHLKDLEATDRCFSCCISSNISCITSEICRPKLTDTSICGQLESSSSEHFQVHRNDKIKEIIEGVLSKHASKRFHEFTELHDITTVTKPRAHLAGIGRSGALHPVPTGKRHHEYRNTCWDHRHLINFASPQEGMSYNQSSGALAIPRAGKYYVYVHTTFYTSPSEINSTSKSNVYRLSHSVKRHHEMQEPNSKSQEKVLIHSKEEKKSFFKPEMKVHKNGADKKIKFHTLHSNGVYKLDKGDQLIVYYQMPDTVRISTSNKETHFGAFMI